MCLMYDFKNSLTLFLLDLVISFQQTFNCKSIKFWRYFWVSEINKDINKGKETKRTDKNSFCRLEGTSLRRIHSGHFATSSTTNGEPLDMFKWKLAFPADRWWVDALRRGSESKWVQFRQWQTPSLWRRREICPKRCRKLGYPKVSGRRYILCVYANKFFYHLDWRSYQEQWHV